jgi:tetratricopeptide (TPR) repeat protein
LRASGQRRLEAIFVTNLGVLEQELQRYDAAERCYARARTTLAELGDRQAEAIALENLAVLEQLRGRLDASEAHHRCALAALEQTGDERSIGLCLARLGGLLSERGDLVTAEALFERGAALLCRLEDRLTHELFELHRGLLDFARGDVERGCERLRSAQRPGPTGYSLLRVSDDARAVVQLLERLALARGVPHLRLALHGHAFAVGDGETCDLTRHPFLARILECLCAAHAQSGDECVDLSALFAAGWPNEKIAWDAAANRVHVALARLRKLGLSGALQRKERGYRLDPSWIVVRRAL